VVLAALPQADGQVKHRPAVLLRVMPPFGDWLVCGVSTQLTQAVVEFDEVIGISDPDFLRLACAVWLCCGWLFGGVTTSGHRWCDRSA
jgi:hypothetical protein